MAARHRFDPKRSYVVARGFTYGGVDFSVGDRFPPEDGSLVVPRTHLERQYGARVINMLPVEADVQEPEAVVSEVAMSALPGGYYEITAPWLDAPVKVRGKANAEAELAKIEEAGRPLGWIAGGSEVVVEKLNDTTFTVSAPWLDDFESFDTREGAEARQLEIHEAGAPIQPVEGHAASVLVTEGDGVFTVTAPWLDGPEQFDTAGAAEERQAQLREAGPPEGWEPEADQPGSEQTETDTETETGGDAAAAPVTE